MRQLTLHSILLGLLGSVALTSAQRSVRFYNPTGYVPLESSRDEKVRWLSTHAIPVRSIDPEDDDFSDLMPLTTIIGNARIVQLGEQSHHDGATFYGKARLVRFLHQQMNFDVLAWELGLFDCEGMNQSLASGKPLSRRPGRPDPWNNGGLLTSFWEWVRASWKTPRPLRQSGIDILFMDYPQERLFAKIDTLDPDLAKPLDRKLISELCAKGLVPDYDPTAEEHGLRRAAVIRVLGRLRERSALFTNQGDVQLLERTLQNVLACGEYYATRNKNQEERPHPDPWNFRDRRMAENIIWLARERYPERKIIVWAAGFHVARNVNTLEKVLRPWPREWVVMGDVLHQELGDQVYTICFTAYQGETSGRRGRLQIAPSSATSLESMLHATGMAYALLDFRSLKANHWLRAPQLARPFGYGEEYGDWGNTVDAFFYTDVMFPDALEFVPKGVKTKRPSQ